MENKENQNQETQTTESNKNQTTQATENTKTQEELEKEKEAKELKEHQLMLTSKLMDYYQINPRNPEQNQTAYNKYREYAVKILNAKTKEEANKYYEEGIRNNNVNGYDYTNDTYRFNTITSFKSDNYPHIILDSEEVENIFFKVKEYYIRLEKHMEHYEKNYRAESFLSGIFNTVQYPKIINDLYLVIEMLIRWAKINETNKSTILSGTQTYINALKEEGNDINRQLTLHQLTIINLQGFINTFHNATKKLLRKGSKNFNNEIPDPYPQSPGKDTTNEINYALDPHSQPKQKENETSKGDNLDKIRNRDSKYKAGGNAYNYELHKLGIDIELAKATSLDFTKEYAHQTATAQTIKGYVLTLCSFHFCKHYKYKFWGDDELDLQSNIPLDMKEREINPYIKRFNSEYSFKQVKAQLNRYNDGLQPNITPIVRLDLINESNAKYADQFLNLYTQLSAENKLKIKEIKEEKGKLYEYTIKYFYKDFKIETLENREQTQEAQEQAEKIIKENKELTNSELQNLLSDYMFNEFSEVVAHAYKKNESFAFENENSLGDMPENNFEWRGIRGTAYKNNNTLNITCIIYNRISNEIFKSQNNAYYNKTYTKTITKSGTYNTQALDYEITSIIKVRYKITLRREVSKSHLQEQIKKIQSLLKDELKEVGITDEYKNINTLEKNGLI